MNVCFGAGRDSKTFHLPPKTLRPDALKLLASPGQHCSASSQFQCIDPLLLSLDHLWLGPLPCDAAPGTPAELDWIGSTKLLYFPKEFSTGGKG